MCILGQDWCEESKCMIAQSAYVICFPKTNGLQQESIVETPWCNIEGKCQHVQPYVPSVKNLLLINIPNESKRKVNRLDKRTQTS